MQAPIYDYKKADLRFDKGLFRDRGNQVIDVTNSTLGNGGAKGDNSVDDLLAFRDAIAAAQQLRVGAPGGSPFETAHVTIYVPLGVFKLSNQLVIPAWVRFVGASRQATVLSFQMADITKDCISVTGDAVSFGYNGSIEEMSIHSTTNRTACRDIINLDYAILYRLDRLTLVGAGRYGLSVSRTINFSAYNVWATGNKSAGLWLGAATSISTTSQFYGCNFNSTTEGPGAEVTGLGIDFYGCTFESNGLTTPSAGYGLLQHYGTAGLHGCYFEDNGSHDVYGGYDDYPAAGRTTVYIASPTFITGAHKGAAVGGIYLDYVDNADIRGGSISGIPKPLKMTANCGEVNISSDFGPGGLVPELTSGAHWRTKTDLTWVNHSNRTQFKDKSAIAQNGTAVLTIPVRATFGAAFRVWFEVYYTPSNDLRAGGYIDIFHDGDGQSDGGASVTILGNDTAGNFRVQSSDFVVTYPSGSSVVVTYTNSNTAAQTNYVDFQIPQSESVVGDCTIA